MPKLTKPSQKDLTYIKTQETQKDLWDAIFSTNYELHDISEETKKYINDLTQRYQLGTVLDNGCGSGRIKKLLEDKGYITYGTDVSIEAIKIASKLAPVNLLCAPSHTLPFKDNFFDTVLFWRVLHNLPLKTRKKAIAEAYRVLKKKGTLICSVQSNEDENTLHIYKTYGKELKQDSNSYIVSQKIGTRKIPYLKHFYSKEDIRNELENQNKFGVLSIRMLIESSGSRYVDKREQKYWVVEAVK